ncbi:MAG TPA: MBL fold metallo-hydrolase [Methanospirillum sp.]|nr:MBL fold metallo-hydrolase [Methanospirillum sp.]
MSGVASIRIIKTGTVQCEGFENCSASLFLFKDKIGVGGGSTVTFIRSDKNILVDTGYDGGWDSRETDARNRAALILALSAAELTPDDIDIIIITHWHFDHTGNISLFPRAQVITSGITVKTRHLKSAQCSGGDIIAEGVSIIDTPGHTEGHISVKVQMASMNKSQRTVIVAGDAIINPVYYMMGKIWDHNPDFFSYDAGYESIRLIQEEADYIIPGHGTIFENCRRWQGPDPEQTTHRRPTRIMRGIR